LQNDDFPGLSGSPVIDIGQELAGQTLAAILRRELPGASWSQVKKRIEQSAVRVNQVVCLDAARRLKEGDVVDLETPSAKRTDWAERVRILHLDHHLAVVEKPSGLTTERRPEERRWPAKRKALQPTLDEILPKLLGGNQRRRDSGGVILVHRLDRDTSGVMVVARTEEAAKNLTAQFRRHSAQRVYRAVVAGHPGTVTISSRLVRDRGDGLRGSADAPVGKEAITHVREIERIGPFALIECRLETGRTNQIRIHLAERNCPVCGEVKYNRKPDGTLLEDTSQAPRLALHAAELQFVHPITHAPLRFLSPWPVDLEKFVERLRSEVEMS
jgi:23S rRNA pseudouridine1911/1915/1917 synthase